MKMTSLFTNVFAIGILLSGMFLMVLIMHLMLKYRDHTVKLPVDREQLLRIPAYGLQPLSYKDGRLCFPSWTETKPIEQATRQAISNIKLVSQWLTKAIGQAIPNKEFSSPVLVFPGWYVTSHNFQQLNAATLPVICNKELNHKQLVKTIPALRSNKEVTQTLPQQQVDAIVYQVAQRCLSKSEVGK
jgi:hypothetical protein